MYNLDEEVVGLESKSLLVLNHHHVLAASDVETFKISIVASINVCLSRVQ